MKKDLTREEYNIKKHIKFYVASSLCYANVNLLCKVIFAI